MKENTSTWICPICGEKAEGVTLSSIVDGGTPYCADCDEEMELVKET